MAARSRAAEIRYPPLTLTTEFSIIRRRTLNTAVAGRIASCSQNVVLTRRNAGKDEEAMAGTRRVAGGLPVVITARVGTDRRASDAPSNARFYLLRQIGVVKRQRQQRRLSSEKTSH